MKPPRKLTCIPGILIALSLSAAAQQKVSDRTSLSAAALAPATDILGIVDISAGASGSKKITIDDLFTGWGFTTAGITLAKAANASAQRTALGLGTAATLNYGTLGGNLVRLDPVTGKLPAVDASNLTGLPGGGDLLSSNNLSDLTSASAARGNLGLVIGADVQAYSSGLAAWSATTPPSSAAAGVSDSQTLSNKTLASGTVITLGSDATGDLWYRDASGNLARLGIGTSGQFLKTTSGVPSWATITGGGDLLAANNLSDLASASTARGNLGLAIGSNVQAWDADLDAWASKTAPTGAVVGLTDTQTLTNKTLTSPVINVGSDGAGDLYYRSSGGAFSRLAAGTDGHVLTLASGLPSWAAASGGGGGGLTNWTEAVSTTSPNATVPVVSFAASNAATNVDVSLSPKGGGGISAHVANDSASGGNKRGQNAVDWQSSRSSASEVASGSNSVISGGSNNRASGGSSSIGGGSLNQATGAWSTTSGGAQNVSSAQGAVISGGETNAVSGSWSAIPGGTGNSLSGQHSFGHGQRSTDRGLSHVRVFANGRFSNSGDRQESKFLMATSTNNATATELTTSGSTASTVTRIVLPNSFSYKFRGQAIARSTSNDTATWEISGVIKRGANAAATTLVGSVTITPGPADSGASTWILDVDADTTNGSLRIRGTGAASTNIRWLVSLETVELGF